MIKKIKIKEIIEKIKSICIWILFIFLVTLLIIGFFEFFPAFGDAWYVADPEYLESVEDYYKYEKNY